MTKPAPKPKPRRLTIGDLSTLVSHAGSGSLLTTLDMLQQQLGVNRKTVQRWLRKLEMQGRIGREKLPGGMLKLVWRGLGSKLPRPKRGPSPGPNLKVVATSENMSGVVPSSRTRPHGKRNLGKGLTPIPQDPVLGLSISQDNLPIPEPRPASGPVSGPDATTTQVAKLHTIETSEARSSVRWWQGRNWPLTIISTVFLVASLTQATLHAAERAHGDPLAFVLIGAIALGIGLAAPVCFHEFVRRTSWPARIALALLGLAAFTINTAGSLGYTGARASASAAQGQAGYAARAEAEADLKRLRDRQALLDREAITARTEKNCGTPQQCRWRGEKLAKDAAALTPQIEAARKAVDGKEVRAAADPAAAFIADLIGLKDGPVRQSFVLGWTLFAETCAAFGFALAIRRGRRA